MAKRRMIDTRFWSDNFVVELNPLDRYLFLYLLTNEHTNICGIYELPLKRMADESGIEKDMLSKMFKRLNGKVVYVEGWVALKNFSKYQSDNESVKKGVENAKKTIPSHILSKIDRVWQGGDRVGTPPDISEPELEPESKLESEFEKESGASSAVPEIIKLFEPINPNYEDWYRNKTQRKAVAELIERIGLEKLTRLVKALPSITSQKTAPRITTPYELKRDWAKLGIFISQQKTIKKEILI